MRMRRQATLYRDTAVESLTLAIELFNRPAPPGRSHIVPMLLGHAFEMVLKSIIFQRRNTVRDTGDELTHSLARCIGIAADDLHILTPADRALLGALKQDRDTATHDTISMSEELLWVHMRAAITLFRRLLAQEFQDDLSELLPGRVVPVSTEPPHDLHALVEDELRTVISYLAPGKRRGPEARARLRPLLSLDGAATGRTDPPTEAEVRKAEAQLRKGVDWRAMLPGLATLNLEPVAPGDSAQEVVLRIGKDENSIPVRRANRDEEALAYRAVNFFDEYGVKLTEFGRKLGLTQQQGYALIWHLDLKNDDRAYYCKRTPAGNVAFQGLSARALESGKAALASSLDLTEITAAYNNHVAASRRKTQRR